MATYTGSWAPSSGANRRMRLILDVTVPTPSPGQTSITVTGTVSVQVGYGVTWRNDPVLSWSGSLLGSGSAQRDLVVGTNGTVQIHSFSQSVSLGSSATTRSVSFSYKGVGYIGSNVTATVAATVSIPPLATVPAPGSVSITRVNDTRVRITWTGGNAHDIEVRRIKTAGASGSDWNDWERLGPLGASRASGTEYNVSTGYKWMARVRRQSGTVWSAWSNSSNRARLFSAPPAPTGLAVTRQADNRHTITWTLGDTASNRPTSQRIEKWSEWAGGWVLVATVAGSVRSYVDTGNHENDRLRWRVRADNAAGVSGWAYTGYVNTTPYGALSLAAERSGPAAVQLTWQNRHNSTTLTLSVQAQTSSNLGATWSAWADMAGHTGLSQATQSRAVSGLDAGLWYRFRVATVAPNTAPNPTLYGYSAASGIIRPAAKPAVPTTLAPSGVVSSAEDVLFRWRHNPTDASDQTAYELRYRTVGDTVWTTLTGTSTATQTRLVPITVPDLWEWQVRTKGQHADYSDWSALGVFEVLDPPTVTITNPVDGGTWPSNRLTVTIAYSDSTGSSMTGWRAELVDATDELVEQITGGPTAPIRFGTDLENHEDYTVRVWVTSGTGLQSLPAETAFTVDFLPPEAPGLDVVWDEPNGISRITVENYAGDGVTTVDTTHNRVERSTDLGATWVALDPDLPLDVGMEDALVPLGTIVWYRAAAISTLDTEATTVVEVTTTSSRVWITGRDGATLMVLANPSLDIQDGHERVSEMYYGRSKPTPHYGEGRPVTVGVSGDLVRDEGYGQDVQPLLGQDVFYRDPTGRAFWASVTSGFGRTMDSGGHQREGISFTVEQIHVDA